MWWWFIGGTLFGAAALLSLLLFLARPRKYRHVSYQELPSLIRGLAEQLHDRGRVYVFHSDTRGGIWIDKRVRKQKPSTLKFRFRNTDETKVHFRTVARAFERAKTAVEIELTKVTHKPRAIVAELDAGQATTYSGLTNLIRIAFDAIGASQDGKLIVYAQDGYSRAAKRPES